MFEYDEIFQKNFTLDRILYTIIRENNKNNCINCIGVIRINNLLHTDTQRKYVSRLADTGCGE